MPAWGEEMPEETQLRVSGEGGWVIDWQADSAGRGGAGRGCGKRRTRFLLLILVFAAREEVLAFCSCVAANGRDNLAVKRNISQTIAILGF